MYWYTIGQTLTQQEHAPAPEQPAVVLLTSEELSHQPALPGLERTLHHTPPARDARVCKAEVRSDCLAGTLVLPRQGKDGRPLACGYLVTGTRVVLVDDENALQGLLRRIAREKRWTDGSVGRFLYDFFEQLIARDLHQLEKIEDRIEALEDRVLAHELDDFSAPMTALRKETVAWFRYYSQLDDVACELHENENGFFTDSEQLLFRMFEDRVIRLREESQLLRESCAQLQSLFQAEIDTRQNRIMQILTIVTTIFLPLTLLVGWYGMNFVGMPELTWKYGYPVVVVVSIVTVGISLWVCKKHRLRENLSRCFLFPRALGKVLRVLDRRQTQRKHLLPEVCIGDDPLAGVDHHRHRQQVGTVHRTLRIHWERADVHPVCIAEIEHFYLQRFRVLVAREHLHAQVGIASVEREVTHVRGGRGLRRAAGGAARAQQCGREREQQGQDTDMLHAFSPFKPSRCSLAERRYSGMAASCAATDTATMAGMLTSYSTPSSQLPRNQNTPNAHSNTP